jgi:DNA polymerase III subunit alpha
VTDTGNLFGALEFALAARDAGVQPIIGCQLGIAREEQGGLNGGTRVGHKPPADQLVLLAQSEAGYRNLLKLSSRAYLDVEPGDTPQVPLSALDPCSEGLIALTGGAAGAVGRCLADGQDEAAEASLRRLAALFPGRLYIELMRHGLAVDARIEEKLIDLAYAQGLPLVATNDAYFAERGLFEAHDALLCIAGGTYVGEDNRRRLTAEHYFKSAAEMRALFEDLPEAVDNTLVIARRCAFMPAVRQPILPAFPVGVGRTEPEELRLRAAEGLERRLEAQVYQPEMESAARIQAAKPYRQRLEFELGVIEQMGFPGYFLIVADFIQWAKAQGIPVGPGRGSGAGSVVAWSLTITDLDPLRWGLLFERFLNPERVSMPDFDIDFCETRRDEVIRYVQQKYGDDRVAQIITFGTLKARAVLRDVGRVLQMPYGQVDRLCKMVPNNPAHPVTLQQAIDGDPMFQHLRDEDPSVGRLIDIAQKLEGLYRHASTHAAGVVIGDRPLDELVPLYRDPRSSLPATQFNMKYVEQAGLVKFDFLGLKTLTVLALACDMLKQRGIDVDLAAIPLDDKKTYDMLSRAEATGIFQLEGSGMRDVLRKLKPDRFEDIIAVVALYRPGPMDNIPRYIACKHGEEEPDYLYPTLEGILKETFGIMIYQEQVIQIAQTLSGYSLGGADLLRRAMGKKIKSEMDAQRKTFIDGAVARGVPEAKAAQIFEQVDKFAGYGFNKSHAAAYALVAYQTAWLKANYPVEFFAASMTLDLGNTDKLNVFKQELDRLKIKLLPPDINRSRAAFTVEDAGDTPLFAREGNGSTPFFGGAIRYALAAVKNVGQGAMEALVKARDEGGPFRDLFDFTARLDAQLLNKRQLENLVAAGAFESLNPNRHQTFAAIETILRHAQSAASERDSQQVSLFGNLEPAGSRRFALPVVPDWPALEKLAKEFDAIGFYLSAHPLDAYGASLKRLGVIRYGDIQAWLATRPTSTRAKLAGVVVNRQERTSARGNRFAFVQLSDQSGIYEATIFADLLATSRELLEPGKTVFLSADVRTEDDSLRLTAQQVRPLDEAVAHAAAGLRIFVKDPEPLSTVKQIIQRQGRGRGKVSLILELDRAREVEMLLPGEWSIAPGTRAAIRAVPGVVEVQDV